MHLAQYQPTKISYAQIPWRPDGMTPFFFGGGGGGPLHFPRFTHLFCMLLYTVHPQNPVKVLMEKGSLKAQRFLTAVSLYEPDKTEDVSRELWMRVWNRDEDITEPQSLREVRITDRSTIQRALASYMQTSKQTII